MKKEERAIKIENAFEEIFNTHYLKDCTISLTNEYITAQDLNRTSHASDLFKLSAIATKVVQAAGRWCENYASDLLITWQDVLDTLDDICTGKNTEKRNIICFGFRTNGIDHNDYIYSNMANLPDINYYYHKIYAVVIDTNQIDSALAITIRLVDIKNIASLYS